MKNLPLFTPSGIPSVEKVLRVFSSDFFREIESYSDKYLRSYRDYLTHYQWIEDSLHQWSRIYEYPFCYYYVRKKLPKGAKILDAGSGVTFFPFLLGKDFEVTCIDQDDYGDIYRAINAGQGTQVRFLQGELRNVPLPSEDFDVIYCISVLEHTKDYPRILSEFRRLLKPDGMLLLTFDLALDGNTDGISPNNALAILQEIKTWCDFDHRLEEFGSNLHSDEIYTTRYVYQWNRQLLPWPQSHWLLKLRNWIRKDKPSRNFRDQIKMTFYCLSTNKSDKQGPLM